MGWSSDNVIYISPGYLLEKHRSKQLWWGLTPPKSVVPFLPRRDNGCKSCVPRLPSRRESVPSTSGTTSDQGMLPRKATAPHRRESTPLRQVSGTAGGDTVTRRGSVPVRTVLDPPLQVTSNTCVSNTCVSNTCSVTISVTNVPACIITDVRVIPRRNSSPRKESISKGRLIQKYRRGSEPINGVLIKSISDSNVSERKAEGGIISDKFVNEIIGKNIDYLRIHIQALWKYIVVPLINVFMLE